MDEKTQDLIEQLQQQLVQAQKLSAVGALASSITHEFNNILTTVINYAKMGLRHEDPAIREKAFTKILNAGQRASKITTGMLKYAKHNSTELEPINLSELVEQCLVLVEKDLQVHRISLDLSTAPEYARVNAGQIQQVLLNLIINARQAMQPGGRLTVHVGRNGEYSEISVADNGCGIPTETLPRIFDQFYSTKEADNQGQGGTGLGLSLCREIIESHNGRIRVESTVGKGTRFTLRLPAVKAENGGMIRTTSPELAGADA